MKKSLNKSVVLLFALALVLAVALAIVPTLFGETASEKAHAEGRTINVTELERSQVGSGELVVSDGDILTGRTQGGHYGNPGSSTVTQGYAFWVKIPDGATITFKDMIMNTLLDFEGIPNFTCDGDATIILEGENSIYANFYAPGITVREGHTVTFKGTGSLKMYQDYSWNGSVCIGAPFRENGVSYNAGNVVFESGTYNFAPDSNQGQGSAIGGFNYGRPDDDTYYTPYTCGDITIGKDVVMTATAGTGASYAFSNCGKITVNGVVITSVEKTFKYPVPASTIVGYINAISDPVEYTSACKTAIDKARAYYDCTTEGQQANVSNYSKLVAAEIAYAELAIDLIPDVVVYSDDCKAKIDGARADYDKLSDENKNNFDADAYKKLTDAEKAYEDLEAGVENVINLIDAIGEVKYPDSGEAIKEARDAYDVLTTEQKAAVTNYDKLVDAEVAYTVLLIDAIGKVEYTPESKEKIDAARSAYDALAATQKTAVDNYETLTDAEARYAAATVDATIMAIGEVQYTPECKEKIVAVKEAYDALTAQEKSYVEKADVLYAAEAKYVDLIIDAIGTVELTNECRDKIYTARDEYDELTSNPRDYVEKLEDLLVAERAYIALMPAVDLSGLTGDYVAQDGDRLTGAISGNYKISVADGAFVVLDNVTIQKVGSGRVSRGTPGINCTGDATIILSGDNVIKGRGFCDPGIYIAVNKTLTIRGEGSLEASGNAGSGSTAAGIGGGYYDDFENCGNIVIRGGKITANGYDGASAIGAYGNCGYITIKGGEVTANGNGRSSGIGSGDNVGNITITDTVVKVAATRGDDAYNSIGVSSEYSEHGTITIGGVVYANGTTDKTFVYIPASAESAIELIAAIPDPVVYTTECKEKIDKAREIYDSLTTKKKERVSNYDVLTAAEDAYQALLDEIDNVLALIEAAPTIDEWTQRNTDKVKAAVEAYEDLSEEQKAGMTVPDDFRPVLVKYLISVLGEEEIVYPDSEQQIAHARTYYNKLSQEQQELIDNYKTLTDAEEEYAALKAELEAAYKVRDLISAIGEVVYPDSVNAINEARKAYNKLPESKRGYVDNYDVLVAAEEKIVELKNAYDKEKAAEVEAIIDALGEAEPTAEYKQKIVDAKNAYNALTNDQKKLVGNYDKIAEAEDAYRAALPAVDLSTLDSDYTVTDDQTITGTLNKNIKISIANNATIVLDNVRINGNGEWAGLTCLGNATIVLKNDNRVNAFNSYYSGIFVPENRTLTIKGDGKLEARGGGNGGAGIGSGYGWDDSEKGKTGTIIIESGEIKAYGGGNGGAGIGSGYGDSCNYQNIEIKGGKVYAEGGWNGAGIGAGYYGNGGSIYIHGGEVEAHGQGYAAGIGGGGGYSYGGSITITNDVEKLYAENTYGGYVVGRGNPEYEEEEYEYWGTVNIGGQYGEKTGNNFYYEPIKPAAVIAKIDAIPEKIEVTDEVKAAIDDARSAYNELGVSRRDQVTNYEKLLTAEETYNDLKAIAAVESLIDAIPETVELTDEAEGAINTAKQAYDKLTEDQKARVSNADVLLAAVEKYNALGAVAMAKALIEDIGEYEYTEEFKEKLDAARDAYDEVPDDYKDQVDNYEVLTTAEAQYKTQDDNTKANEVIALIDAIPNEIGLENLDEATEKTEAAREAYDELSDEAKEIVGEDKYEKLTDAESTCAITNVIALINEIPEELENTTECIRKIDAAFDAYDALSSKQKPQVYKDYKMKLFEAEAWLVDEMIDEIGDVEYTPACKEKIDDARAEYEKLSATVNNTYNEAEADKIAAAMALVTKYEVLVEAEADYKVYDDEAKAAHVEELIANIGEVELTVNSKTLIDTAREEYDALSDDQKEIVSNYDVLTAAESAYKILVAEDAIENIGNVTYTAESKAKIDAAREAFDALSDEEKAKVENASVLTAAESKYAKMKADEEAAATVRAKIEAIGDVTYTAESKAKIDEAREAYDALSEEQKALVGNVSDLTNAESEYGRLEDNAKIAEVKALIESIGTVEYSESSKAKISAARQAYDNLTDAQKALLDATEVETLTTAETVYEQKEIEATTEKKGLSGGAIAGIVIGVVIGALLLACVVLYLLNKKKIVKLAFVDKATEKVTDVAGKIKDKFGKKDAQKGEEPKQEAQQEEPKQEEPVQEEPQQEAAEEEPAKAESTEDEAHE